MCRDPRTIPPRRYLLEPAYIRQFSTGTVALGGIGKTGLLTVDALVLATGLPLLGVAPRGKFRVGFWNGEDPLEELQRSFEGARQHHGLTPEDIGDRLFVDSGRQLPIEIATQDRSGTKVAVPLVGEIIAALKAASIDVLILDPFVSTHSVPENDNGGIDRVTRTWNEIAEAANVAIHFAFHTTKIGTGEEATAMNLRGASAALNKLRYVRVLNRLSKDAAPKIGIEPRYARQYISIDDFGEVEPAATRRRADVVQAGLGEPAERRREAGRFRARQERSGACRYAVDPSHHRRPEADRRRDRAGRGGAGDRGLAQDSNVTRALGGVPIARALGLDLADPVKKTKVSALVSRWVEKGWLVKAKPEESDGNGNKREGYAWAGGSPF